MRKIVIAGNWKMNQTSADIVEFMGAMEGATFNGAEAIICAPTAYVKMCNCKNQNDDLKIGFQNMHFEEAGAFTGETSPAMVKDLGAQYVILGHSERRVMFGETNAIVNAKVKAAHKFELTPIFALGEVLEERENGTTFEVLKTQLNECLADLTNEEMANTIVAYEPVWAIGTGKVATNEQAEEACKFIREELTNMFDAETAEKVVIQYGGSVTPDTIKDLLSQPNIDGALVGGASLKADSFLALFNF